MTTEPADQNTDNIQIISIVMFETASLLGQTLVEGNLEPAVIQMVSCNTLSSSSLKDKWSKERTLLFSTEDDYKDNQKLYCYCK